MISLSNIFAFIDATKEKLHRFTLVPLTKAGLRIRLPGEVGGQV